MSGLETFVLYITDSLIQNWEIKTTWFEDGARIHVWNDDESERYEINVAKTEGS